MTKLNGLELQATTKMKWVRSKVGLRTPLLLQDTTKFNPMIGFELHAMANYQFNNNIKQLALILGTQETSKQSVFRWINRSSNAAAFTNFSDIRNTLFNHSNEAIRCSLFNFSSYSD
jgi:hypothetical protein